MINFVKWLYQQTSPIKNWRREYFVALVMALGLFACASMFAEDQPSTADRSVAQTSSGAGSDQSSGPSDSGWHLAVSPYLWFPGVSGTVGVLGLNAGVHASPGDVLSHFDIGLLGAAEIRKKRLVIPLDIMWIKLQGDRATPFNPGLSYVNVKITQTILTPGVGYRVVNEDKLKVDARVGLRYWHLGQNLSFQPSGLFSNSSRSGDWVDIVAGGKVEGALTPKLSVTILGDAGAGGANLDYEVVALLGLKVSQKLVLQAGWRHLDVDYRTRPANLVRLQRASERRHCGPYVQSKVGD